MTGDNESMKARFRSFYKQPLFVCMLAFFIAESMLSVIFRMEMAEKVPLFYLFAAIAADMLFPSVFAFAAYYFKRPVFAACAVLSMLPVLFVKIFNVILYSCTYSVFHPHTALILLGHTDAYSMRVYCGEWYYVWIP